MALKLVRGKIVGGTGPLYLIAVDERWGRVYWMLGRRLGPMQQIQSILAQNPEAFSMPFDGTQEEEDAILDAAADPDEVDPQPRTHFPLPNVDIVDREEIERVRAETP